MLFRRRPEFPILEAETIPIPSAEQRQALCARRPARNRLLGLRYQKELIDDPAVNQAANRKHRRWADSPDGHYVGFVHGNG
jgi:hypothetical protein